MLFGMQRPQLEPEQILAARNRLQARMEADPSVTSMQPGSSIPLDITGGKGLAQPLPQAQPDTAFQWGAGGARLSPEDIASRRKMAQALMAAGMDYSPVGHWTQGVARVAQALIGSMRAKKLDKAAQQNTDYERQILQTLAGTGAGSSSDLLTAMGDKSLSDNTRDVLKLRYQALNKTPAAPHYFETNNGSQGMIGPDGKPQILYKDPDPKMNFIPDGMGGGNWVAIPSMGGGDAAPAAVALPTAPVGKITPIGGGAPSQGGATFP